MDHIFLILPDILIKFDFVTHP